MKFFVALLSVCKSLTIICSKIHFSENSYDAEASQLIWFAYHLTVFNVIRVFTEQVFLNRLKCHKDLHFRCCRGLRYVFLSTELEKGVSQLISLYLG